MWVPCTSTHSSNATLSSLQRKTLLTLNDLGVLANFLKIWIEISNHEYLHNYAYQRQELWRVWKVRYWAFIFVRWAPVAARPIIQNFSFCQSTNNLIRVNIGPSMFKFVEYHERLFNFVESWSYIKKVSYHRIIRKVPEYWNNEIISSSLNICHLYMSCQNIKQSILKGSPCIFFDVLRQKGCWKIPKGPPFSFFRHCEIFSRKWKFLFSSIFSCFATEWMLKNVKGSTLSVFRHCETLARQGLALASPGAPLGPFFWVCNFFEKIFFKNFRFSSTVKEYLTLGSLFAIFEPWIWRRLGPVPACYQLMVRSLGKWRKLFLQVTTNESPMFFSTCFSLKNGIIDIAYLFPQFWCLPTWDGLKKVLETLLKQF